MVFQERTYSVLLVTASDSFTAKIMPLLPVTDYWPVTTVHSVGEARRKIVETSFDIVLINAPLPDDFGLHLAVDICTGSGAGSPPAGAERSVRRHLRQSRQLWRAHTGKPTGMQMVAQNLRVLCATRERMRQMEAKQATVEERIEEIRLVNRAKWLLIECLGMTEPEAHRYIEKQSMDQRISKREVAESVIRTYK